MSRITRSTVDEITTIEDELPTFVTVDKLTNEALKQNITFHEFHSTETITYETDNDLWIQSSDFVSSIPKLLLKIHTDMWYE